MANTPLDVARVFGLDQAPELADLLGNPERRYEIYREEFGELPYSPEFFAARLKIHCEACSLTIDGGVAEADGHNLTPKHQLAAESYAVRANLDWAARRHRLDARQKAREEDSNV